jgi:hypothetical protein
VPIKNYTSNVDPFVSIGEIQGALAKAGAAKIMVDYDDGEPIAVSFMLRTPVGDRGFSLPAPVDGTLRAFTKQRVKGADEQQAKRTAWRNIRDWILAQCALIESCDVPIDQVFLPYLTDNTGRTLYEVYRSGQLLLGEGGAT